MIYVMSDLHGEYDKFLKMLELIEFSSSDTLYILGDVLDRGKKSLEIIDYIRKEENSNIELIMGNHESFCIEALLRDDYFAHWMLAGGDTTYAQLKERGAEYTLELLDYLSELPTYKILDGFILTHAGVEILTGDEEITDIEKFMDNQPEEVLLWDREFIDSNKSIDGYTVICGHTPTVKYMQYGHKASMVHRLGKILIDCGAHFSNQNGRLGCLRLDDLKEFYID